MTTKPTPFLAWATVAVGALTSVLHDALPILQSQPWFPKWLGSAIVGGAAIYAAWQKSRMPVGGATLPAQPAVRDLRAEIPGGEGVVPLPRPWPNPPSVPSGDPIVGQIVPHEATGDDGLTDEQRQFVAESLKWQEEHHGEG